MVPPDHLKFYQTVNEKTISQYPSPEQDNICSSAFRTDKKNIYFEKKKHGKTLKTFKNKKSKSVLFRKKSFLIFDFLSILILLLIY